MPNLANVTFWLDKVVFLGHVISTDGVSIDPTQIVSAVNWERQKTTSDIRSFLGLAGYNRRFVQGFSSLAAPLTKLTRKNEPFNWSEECEQSF